MWVPHSTHSSITKAIPRVQVAGNELDITIARHALLHRFTFNHHRPPTTPSEPPIVPRR